MVIIFLFSLTVCFTKSLHHMKLHDIQFWEISIMFLFSWLFCDPVGFLRASEDFSTFICGSPCLWSVIPGCHQTLELFSIIFSMCTSLTIIVNTQINNSSFQLPLLAKWTLVNILMEAADVLGSSTKTQYS